MKRTAATLPMNGSVSNEPLAGWPASSASDYNPSTVYSSSSFPTSTNSRNVWLQTSLATAGPVNRVNIRARCTSYNPCVKNGFPVSYHVHVFNGVWNFSGTFTQQPDNLGVVSLSIPQVNSATVIQITPAQLGTDNFGNHYFQLAELQPAYDL